VSSKGKICILDIDIQGVKQVKTSGLLCKYIFISPPSQVELEKRLRERGTETDEKIQIRLKNSVAEIEFGHVEGNFDAVIINENLSTAVEEITQLFRRWYSPDLLKETSETSFQT
jgi:guanylate kinase